MTKTPFLDLFGPSSPISGQPDFIFTMSPLEIESPYIDWTTHKKSSKSLEPLSSKTTKTPFLGLFGPSGPISGRPDFIFTMGPLEIERPHIDLTTHKKSSKSLEPLSNKMTKTPFLDLFWPSSPDFGPARFLFQNRAPWLCSKYPSQSSCQKSEKSLEPFSRKWCEYLPTYLPN